MDAFETLTASYFDGQLTEREAAEMAHVLENDVEKATWFVGEYEIDRLLVLRVNPPDQSRIDAIITQIQREADPFVQSVFRAIEHETFASTERVQSWRDGVAQLFSRPGWALLAASFLGLLSCAWFFYYGITAGEPRLELAENSLIDVLRNGVLTRAQHGFALRAGDVLNVPGTSAATISYAPEQTLMTIRPGTNLKLASVSGAKRFVLDAGKIEASVARQRTFKPMVILTPQAEARILGTRFVLAANTNATRLEVTEGEVKFTRTSDGKMVKVCAGTYALAQANADFAALPATGRILHEVWTNYPGKFMPVMTSDASVADHPQSSGYATRCEAVTKAGDRFGQRLRGYLHPPVTGEYRFFLAATGPGKSFLFLSPDDKPQSRTQIAEGDTTPQGTRPAPPPLSIPLVAGRKYYIKALHESETGHGGLRVRWQGPNRQREVIPGEFLSPFPVKEKQGQR